MKIDSLLGCRVLVGSSLPMNIERDLSIQMHTKHMPPEDIRMWRYLLQHLRSKIKTYIYIIQFFFWICVGEKPYQFFLLVIWFWGDNFVRLMLFLMSFLLRNHLWNWRNFFGNFLCKRISTITSISCTGFRKFPTASARVREEHLSRKTWLVLNWPRSQHCAKNNHCRSVFVSNSTFSFPCFYHHQVI